MKRLSFYSVLGWITLKEEEGAIVELSFEQGFEEESPLLLEAKRQLEEYFRGERENFTLPLRTQGTSFQKKVWDGLGTITYGETLSYEGLAKRVGHPKACRAVGGANGKNPIPILIPCHRVISKDGSLGGFSSGLEKKKILLQLEETK